MIPQTFDESFERVQKLVSDFHKNEKRYLSPSYSEAQARHDFVDKFWIALGWDVNHELQTNPYEQEVKIEHSVDLSAARKRADYAFLAPNFRDVRFYVEAKRPYGQIDAPDNYFQTIRYGWNSKTPLAVLTNFQELRILDCRFRPDIHTALQRVAKKFHCLDCTDEQKFKEIYHLFSRQAVNNGSIEKFVENQLKANSRAQQKKLFNDNYLEIDESFLKELDRYREELARMFKRKNSHLNSEELTEATQRTIDRLVFIRFLEDKLIEPESLVEKFGDSVAAWKKFVAISRKLDTIYNGIIFKAHHLIDDPSFNVDEQTFVDICDGLAHIHSPYDFNAIPIHILGSIYERFLGKVIIATDKRARVEEKPEVRKAGGVYYTPEYIVRYIVKSTIGKLIKGKKPEEICQMRFADISCGSGSFLLGIYDLLLRHHTAYYNKNKRTRAEGSKAGCRQHDDGTLRLSLKQRREILLNNIYGVDIDAQAVEVAQLSLYLKMLEDETTASAKSYQLELREALLPSLNKNIICGNSLIGWDIIERKLFETNEERKLNLMNFEDAFPTVMKAGGFDAIVGNPAYGAEIPPSANAYLRAKFQTATASLDTYPMFIEQSLKLLKPYGKLSMIVPTGWYSGVRFSALRRLIARTTNPEVFVNLPYDIFAAWVDTTIFAVTKRQEITGWPRRESCSVTLRTFPKRHKIMSEQEFEKETQLADFLQWFSDDSDEYLTYADSATTSLMRKIKNQNDPLEKLADVQRGVTPFHFTEKPDFKTSRRAFDGTVRRYTIDTGGIRYIRFDKSLAEPKPEKYFIGPRILLRELISRQFQLQAVKVTEDFVTNKSMQSILQRPSSPDLNYLLGILNSRLMSWYFLRRSNIAQRDDFPKIVLKETRQLPIPAVNMNSPSNKAQHDKMVQLVEQMISAKEQLAEARTDKDKTFYENKCAVIDRQIDQLVYELYCLSDEEIRIIGET